MLPGRNNFNKIRRLGKKHYVYSAKTYHNPFFRRQTTRLINPGGWPGKKKLIITSLITSGLIIVWLVFFSNLFKIYDIKVSGVDDNLAKEVAALARGIAGNGLLNKNNLLLFDKDELVKSLNEKYYLDSLTVKRKLFHTLAINLHEKRQVAVWLEAGKYYYLDDVGKIINQVDPLNINRQSLPLIENLTSLNLKERQTNISQAALDYVIELFQEFKEQKHGLEIEKFIIDNNVNTVKMAVLGGPKIFFNITAAISQQAAELDLVIKEKLKDNFKTREYIDLRFGNNIYIK